MAGRSGFLGGLLQTGAPEWGAENGHAQESFGGGYGANPGGNGFRFAGSQNDPNGMPPGFDPVWGTLGAPAAQTIDPWSAGPVEEDLEGRALEVEVFGNGFQISGQIHTGQFDRLSDWLNMQTGFIRVSDARHVHLGHDDMLEEEGDKGTLWIRVDQIVLMAERAAFQQAAPGTPVVQKQRRKVSIVTPGYNLRGSLHVHVNGTMKQFLQMSEPHFLPITDLTVRWLDNPRLAARFPFAVVNRAQLLTIFDEPTAPTGDSASRTGNSEGELSEAGLRRWGAA
jgi:hypothetical protein